jgi:hypothetical protein
MVVAAARAAHQRRTRAAAAAQAPALAGTAPRRLQAATRVPVAQRVVREWVAHHQGFNGVAGVALGVRVGQLAQAQALHLSARVAAARVAA